MERHLIDKLGLTYWRSKKENVPWWTEDVCDAHGSNPCSLPSVLLSGVKYHVCIATPRNSTGRNGPWICCMCGPWWSLHCNLQLWNLWLLFLLLCFPCLTIIKLAALKMHGSNCPEGRRLSVHEDSIADKKSHWIIIHPQDTWLPQTFLLSPQLAIKEPVSAQSTETIILASLRRWLSSD